MVFTGAHTSQKYRLDTVHYAVICHQRNLELVSRTIFVTSTSSRWMNVGSGSIAELLTGEHAKHVSTCQLPHFLSAHGSCRAAGLYSEHMTAAAAAHTPSTLKNSAIFVGIDVS